jgi:hypothetical protein
MMMIDIYLSIIWASRFVAALLASGYPLHHPPTASQWCGWFRYYPSRKNKGLLNGGSGGGLFYAGYREDILGIATCCNVEE